MREGEEKEGSVAEREAVVEERRGRQPTLGRLQLSPGTQRYITRTPGNPSAHTSLAVAPLTYPVPLVQGMCPGQGPGKAESEEGAPGRITLSSLPLPIVCCPRVRCVSWKREAWPGVSILSLTKNSVGDTHMEKLASQLFLISSFSEPLLLNILLSLSSFCSLRGWSQAESITTFYIWINRGSRGL